MLRKIGPMVLLVAGAGVATLYADTTMAPLGGAPEMQARATEVLQQINTEYHAVLAMQARARQQKDVIKLNCVNDKLIQIKAEMNIADSAASQLRFELAAGDKATGATSFSQLQEASAAIHDLRQQGAACLGQVELSNEQVGATSTHPMFPDDPLVIPFDVYVEPPVYASPYN